MILPIHNFHKGISDQSALSRSPTQLGTAACLEGAYVKIVRE